MLNGLDDDDDHNNGADQLFLPAICFGMGVVSPQCTGALLVGGRLLRTACLPVLAIVALSGA